jgi:hypothetical protein
LNAVKLTFIALSLNPNVDANGWYYFLSSAHACTCAGQHSPSGLRSVTFNGALVSRSADKAI